MSGFLALSFFAGVLTVVAPCVLPLLPVIIGRSVSEETSSRRLAMVVVSLGLSIFLFTLLLKASAALISIPAGFWQILSGALITFFGLVTIFPGLWDSIPGVQKLYLKSNRALGTGYRKQSLWGDIIMGAALGPVFSSCSPTYFVILAAVLPAHFATGLIYLLAYCVGMCLFLFVIALFGQKAAEKIGFAADSKGLLRKILGIIFILVGLAVITGYDKKIEYALPQGAFAEVSLEQRLLAKKDMPAASSSTPAEAQAPAKGYPSLAEKALMYPPVPELVSPDGFINTGGNPISLAQYRGKSVVLVDFWDYSCINCQRATPYLNAWYEKYKDQGLVIIGVHTPEFAFEHSLANVQAAADKLGIKYPVVLDNEYQTWGAFKNNFWPREYLVDIDGYIIHDHAGEGEYDQTEAAIQYALAERAQRLGQSASAVATSTVSLAPTNFSDIRSPETYFGSARNQYLGNGKPGIAGAQTLALPDPSLIKPNTLYLGGMWSFFPEYAEAWKGAQIFYQYGSHDVYLVAANLKGSARIKVFRDGVPVGKFAGADVDPSTSEAVISGDRLYKLIHDDSLDVHTVRIEVEEGTLDAYTFTFG